MQNKLGRLPREFDPAIPHYSTLRMLSRRKPLSSIPVEVNYTTNLPADLGMMLNDQLGDCTSAGCYHAVQVWSQNAQGTLLTAPDSSVEEWYSEVSGYDPTTGANDNGANEQDVLKRWLNTGLPLTIGRDKLLGYVEIDPRNEDDINRAIFEAGLVYIGFEVPSDIPEAPGSTWDNCNGPIEGGHCVILPGFDSTQKSRTVISWGSRYTMTYEFWDKYVDEAYALIDSEWMRTTGQTLLGMTADELEQQMKAIAGK